jgi:PAS domain S-box-containing protein
VNTKLGTLDLLGSLPLERALQHTAVGLAACDAEGRLTVLSPVLQEILGREFTPVGEDEFTFTFDLIDGDGEPVPTEQIPIVRARQGEFVRDELLVARRPDGEFVHLRCNAAPLEDAQGRITGAVAFVQDVTAEVLARQQVVDERRQLLERVHHEIRTPLSSLVGHLELLDEVDAELPYRVDLSLQAIRRAADRLHDLLAELDESVTDRSV